MKHKAQNTSSTALPLDRENAQEMQDPCTSLRVIVRFVQGSAVLWLELYLVRV